MSISPERERQLYQLAKEETYSAVISDSLDQIGVRDQVMLHNIRPVFPEAVLCGKAFTILSMDVYEMAEDPYTEEIAAIDSLKPGDVVVWATHESVRTGVWGELLSTACVARGAVGAVTDGLARDIKGIIRLSFPVFCRGIAPLDSAGRSIVTHHQVRVMAGGVTVNPGDYVFADFDGVVVIPAEHFETCIEKAVEKATKENHSIRELREGKLLREVYEKYGVL